MKYDTYVEYCNLIEKLHSEAMDALYNACGAEIREDHIENGRHRAIRMVLENAVKRISTILAAEERSNPSISPEDYNFAGRDFPEVNFNDGFYEALDREAAI